MIKKLFEYTIVKLFDSELFKELIFEKMKEYTLYTPKIIGPKDRLYLSKHCNLNNVVANTNSGEIRISDHVFFGKNVCLITGTHNFNKFSRDRIKDYPKQGNDIIIEEGAWVATNAIILGPCKIGKHSVIGAGSVVTKDVPEYTVVVGNPARQIKAIKKSNEIET